MIDEGIDLSLVKDLAGNIGSDLKGDFNADDFGDLGIDIFLGDLAGDVLRFVLEDNEFMKSSSNI